MNLGDIKDIDIDNLPYTDIITHGSPCQDFSIAGNQKGADKNSNTRSSLMWHTVEIIKKVNPKYVIWENVKNVLSDKHKHNFENYLEVLRSNGYINHSKVINAKHWGIPQNRERIFIVSIREDLNKNFKFPISSLERQQSLFNQNVVNIEPKILADVLTTDVDEKYYISDDKVKIILKKFNFRGKQKFYCCPLKFMNRNQNNLPAKYFMCLDANNTNGVLEKDKKSVRKLTPIECFRLMGFSDRDYWKARDKIKKKCAKNNEIDLYLYKMAGNSIVVNVLEYIFKELFKEKLQKKVS